MQQDGSIKRHIILTYLNLLESILMGSFPGQLKLIR